MAETRKHRSLSAAQLERKFAQGNPTLKLKKL